MSTPQPKLILQIENFIEKIDVKSIKKERNEALQDFIDYIKVKHINNQEIRLNFICTHNSRRSLLAQIWAQTMAFYFDIKNVSCYSSGTERTAVYPMVLETLENVGFKIEAISQDDNPIYSVKYAPDALPVIAFSKKLDNSFNPKSQFVALMTCSEADGGCPFIFGADKRIPITYEDPKISDNTPSQAKTYQERSLQIATEMFYLFSQIKA